MHLKQPGTGTSTSSAFLPRQPTHPAQNNTISISNPKDPRKYAAAFASVVAATSKLLAYWAKNAPAEAAKLAELMGEDSAWLIEALEQTAVAAGSAAQHWELSHIIWPSTAQAPTIPPAPLSTVTSDYISWTDPVTGITTVMTADGVVLSISPAQIGQVNRMALEDLSFSRPTVEPYGHSRAPGR